MVQRPGPDLVGLVMAGRGPPRRVLMHFLLAAQMVHEAVDPAREIRVGFGVAEVVDGKDPVDLAVKGL